MSHVAIVKTSSERDTQRDRVSRSVTDGRTDGRTVGRSDGRMDGRTDGRTAGANLEVYIVMGNLRLQSRFVFCFFFRKICIDIFFDIFFESRQISVA